MPGCSATVLKQERGGRTSFPPLAYALVGQSKRGLDSQTGKVGHTGSRVLSTRPVLDRTPMSGRYVALDECTRVSCQRLTLGS
jgi:hypothetical protein